MWSKQTRLFFCSIITLTILAVSGCVNSKVVNTDQLSNSNSLTKLVISDAVWGQLLVEDQVTAKNVSYLLSKLKGSKINASDLVLSTAIKTQLVFEDHTTTMYFSPDWAYDGEKVYEGKECGSIVSILSSEIFSPAQLGKLSLGAKKITLKAKDLNQEQNSLDKRKLSQGLSCSQQVKSDTDAILQLPPTYPYYIVDISLSNNKIVEVIVLSSDLFVVNDLERFHVFSNGKGLWDYCLANIVAPTPKPNQLTYLFQASEVKSSNLEGSLLPKKLGIARLLTNGAISNLTPSSNPNCELSFMIDGKQYSVLVYNDYFVFQGSVYRMLGVAEELEKIISAG